MADVEGQPHLRAALERMVKAAEKQKRRLAAGGGAQQPGDASSKKPNLNMVFGGGSGTGKTSSVEKIAKVLAEVGVLDCAKVVELNKTTKLQTTCNVPVAIGEKFEEAKGGILFLDEVHSRTDSGPFVDALMTLLSKYEGSVMVIIAGYHDKVMHWLRTKDEGLPRRFPEDNRIEFLPLEWDVLVKIGQNRLKEQCFTLSEDDATRKAFENVMHYEAGKNPSENAGGAINAVDAMIRAHDARDDVDDDDCCITAVDINEACPKAIEAATAPSLAPAPSPAAAAAPAAAATAAAGARRSSASGSQASSSAAAAGSSTAGAAAEAAAPGPAAVSDPEEDEPLSKRSRVAVGPSQAAPPPAPVATSSRKRKAESGDARAEVDLPSDLSSEAESMVQAIDARYTSDEAASSIAAWDLLTDLHQQRLFEKDSSVHEKMEQATKLGKNLKRWLTEAIDHISARGDESENVKWMETPREQKLMIDGLRRKN